MPNPVEVDRWALLHLVLSVGLLPEPGEPHERDDLRRCLAACVEALRPDVAPVDVPRDVPDDAPVAAA